MNTRCHNFGRAGAGRHATLARARGDRAQPVPVREGGACERTDSLCRLPAGRRGRPDRCAALRGERTRGLRRPSERDTTLLIAPNTLSDFLDFNDFTARAERRLARAGFEGQFQLASFHPHYPVRRHRGRRHHQCHQSRAVPHAAPAARRQREPRGRGLSRRPRPSSSATSRRCEALGAAGWAALDVGPGGAAAMSKASRQGLEGRSRAAGELRPGQSIELLKELHILTRDGRLNQDSRRKLKQVYHLYQFIEKLLLELPDERRPGHAGRPRRRQVVPRLHPLRPVLQGARRRARLRHRDAGRTGGEVARARCSGWASSACPS